MDYRIDGLRFDAVHAIPDQAFLSELARRVRMAAGPDRHVHLVLENEKNCAALLECGFDAQWNDDGHNVLHTILTGEQEGYYRDFSSRSTQRLARCLAEGFVYQGERTASGQRRGQPSGHLSPTSFVLFLQNHDQVGNRAQGERLVTLADENALKAATALLLLCPMVPLLFMGEEWGTGQPFLYFTDHPEPLAQAVRDGRQREFQGFSAFGGGAAPPLPDPNHIGTFLLSRPFYVAEDQTRNGLWHSYYSELLRLRHRHILPRLPGTRSRGVAVLGEAALSAQWLMGDGATLRIDINLGATAQAVEPFPDEDDIVFSHGLNAEARQLNPGSVGVWLRTTL